MTENDQVYQLRLPESMPPLDEWLVTYGQKLLPDDLNKLVHFKNQIIPYKSFAVWCDRALMGRHHGWILKDVMSIRILWHSLGAPKNNYGWYYVARTMAMSFTDAPVF